MSPMTSPSQPFPRPPGVEGLLEHLGPRARRRATPRLGVALAGAGAIVAVLGSLFVGFDELFPEGFGEPNETGGIIVTLVVMGAGYGLLAATRDGPLATAGATASALALPFLLFFVTFDPTEAPGFSVDAVLLVSTIGWTAAYLLGPGRGRPFFFGSALVGVWLFILEQVESVFSAPFDPFTTLFFQQVDGFGGTGFQAPDPGTIGVISLMFGAAYLVAAFGLDRLGGRGFATPCLAVGVVALGVGYVALAEDLELMGTGVLVTATGSVVAYFGAWGVRRGTAWLGAAAVGLGLVLIVADITEDSSLITIGVVFLLVGVALVALAHSLAQGWREPSELGDQRWAGLFPPPPPRPPSPPATAA